MLYLDDKQCRETEEITSSQAKTKGLFRIIEFPVNMYLMPR